MRKLWNHLKDELSPTRISSRAATIWIAIPLWLLVGLVALWAVVFIPRWQVDHSSAAPTLENEYRKTVAQIIGGLLAMYALYFTWRRVRVTEQGHITDRYTQAIEQLGKLDGDKPNIEIRLGAIYALERIAADSPRDHWTIMEVLTAYVRQNAPAIPDAPEQDDVKPRSDIQAILTVIGRRRISADREKDGRRLDLGNADLCGANLRKAQLQGADLTGTQLEKADLPEAKLQGADLTGAQLQGAYLNGVQLQGARLTQAQLQNASLTEAQLQNAYLNGAKLQNASLVEAQLQGAQLANVQLHNADLHGAQLQGVKFIKVDQIKTASNWEHASYDPEFAALLGLDPSAPSAGDSPSAQ